MIKIGVITMALVGFLNAGWFANLFDATPTPPIYIQMDLSKPGDTIEGEFRIKEKWSYFMSLQFLDIDSRKNNYKEAKKVHKFLGYRVYDPSDGKLLGKSSYSFAKEDLARGGVFIDENYNLDGTIVPLHVTLSKIGKDGIENVILDKKYMTKGGNGGRRKFEHISLHEGRYSIKVKNIKGFSELKGMQVGFYLSMTRRYK